MLWPLSSKHSLRQLLGQSNECHLLGWWLLAVCLGVRLIVQEVRHVVLCHSCHAGFSMSGNVVKQLLSDEVAALLLGCGGNAPSGPSGAIVWRAVVLDVRYHRSLNHRQGLHLMSQHCCHVLEGLYGVSAS